MMALQTLSQLRPLVRKQGGGDGYTSYQRPNTISEDGITASFAYNSAGDRVKMDVKQGTTALLTRYYIGGQYELDTQTNTERLYLGGDAYSAH